MKVISLLMSVSLIVFSGLVVSQAQNPKKTPGQARSGHPRANRANSAPHSRTGSYLLRHSGQPVGSAGQTKSGADTGALTYEVTRENPFLKN